MICGLLLAAGSARRFGADKLQIPLSNGMPMALVSAHKLLSSVDCAVAVVRPEATELIEQLRLIGYETIPCTTTSLGMSESLKIGIRATIDAEGWVITLADMPMIHEDTFQTVVDHLRRGAFIVAPYHRGRRGHPIGFRKQFKPELLTLTGDKGAAEIVEKYPEQVKMIDCPDSSIHMDIDTLEDLHLYREMLFQ